MSGETDRLKWRGVRPVEGVSGVWPARNATRINKSEFQLGVGITKIYTVIADKKLFMSNAGITSRLSVAVATWARMGVKNVDDGLKYYLFYHYHQPVAAQSSFQLYVPALEALVGDYVFVESNNANLNIRGFVQGWLEDA